MCFIGGIFLFLCHKHGLLSKKINIALLIRLEKNDNNIYKISHEVYGLETISKIQFFVRMKLFQDGRGDVTAHEWSGGLTTSRSDSNVEKLTKMTTNSHQLTV
jgi:hypothetical protein